MLFIFMLSVAELELEFADVTTTIALDSDGTVVVQLPLSKLGTTSIMLEPFSWAMMIWLIWSLVGHSSLSQSQ